MILTLQDINTKKTYNVDESLEIARGGEGRLLPLQNGLVVKLYFDKTRIMPQQKFNELNVLDDEYFIKPKAIVECTSNGEKGIVMDELDNSIFYPLYSLYTKTFAMKHALPTDFKTIVANKLIKAVKCAHDHNIIIGDLNPFNIMVNDKLEVKIIDVDSFETPSFKHNGKLLEEIRDFSFNGLVTLNSDYFALAVIIFNLFTGLHPFKGIHNVYRDKLKDREINNLSVISNHVKDIKIPPFYMPITDDNLLNTFKEIFNENKRFLIDLTGKQIKQMIFNGTIISDNLLITTIFNNLSILNVSSSKSFICITTDTEYIIMKTPAKGIITNLVTIKKDMEIILTDKHVIGLKNGVLYAFNDATKTFVELTGIKLNHIHVIKQYENILFAITKEDIAYTINLDEIFRNNVLYSSRNMYHKSFFKYEGLIQRVGKANYIFYSNGKSINQLMYPEKIEDLSQIENIGIVSKIGNNGIEYELFTIDKYDNIKRVNIPEKYNFTLNDKFIILYKDNSLSFIDRETLIEVAAINVTGLNNYAILSNKSGIMAFNQTEIKLLNTK